MGYSIYIGNGEMEPVEVYDDDDDPYTTPYFRDVDGKRVYYKPTVSKINRDDAPTFPNDELTGNGNSRHPSYVGWDHFCTKVGLKRLFFDDEAGLMREHPGFQVLRIEHAQAIDAALKRYKQEHPDAIPGFEQETWGREEVPKIGYDGILARLIWLDWWVKWALANCENAGICNW